MSITAMKQALEALELNNAEWKSLADSGDTGYWRAEDQSHYKQTNEAITALRTAIEQAETAQGQEPVVLEEYDAGLLNDYGGGNVGWWWDYIRYELGRAHDHYQEQVENLYTTPPAAPVQEQFGPKEILQMIVDHAAQREWVGLTQQDIDIAFDDTQEGGGFDEFARAIEAKLKEKNNA